MLWVPSSQNCIIFPDTKSGEKSLKHPAGYLRGWLTNLTMFWLNRTHALRLLPFSASTGYELKDQTMRSHLFGTRFVSPPTLSMTAVIIPINGNVSKNSHLNHNSQGTKLNTIARRHEGWTRWPTEVPSNPYHSVILSFCETTQWAANTNRVILAESNIPTPGTFLVGLRWWLQQKKFQRKASRLIKTCESNVCVSLIQWSNTGINLAWYQARWLHLLKLRPCSHKFSCTFWILVIPQPSSSPWM